MRIERLVAMANDIGAFFSAASTPSDGPGAIASHLKRFWDPRMRRQLVEYYRSGGEGLDGLVRSAVELLAEPSRVDNPPA
jgi:formate dehydrogenase subunit delta